MKRLFALSSAAAILIAGCGGVANVLYGITFDVQDPSQRAQLLLMVQRVVERRLASMGEEGTITNLKPTAEGAEMILELEDEIVADAMTSQLTEPFSLEVMKESDPANADITVAGHGSFAKTGINEDHMTWVQAQPQAGGPMAIVTIGFTDEGRTLMQKLFKESKGRFVGVFVRGKLVSKLKVETDELKDDVVIQDIPSFDLATTFADDVNVGLHITITKLPWRP